MVTYLPRILTAHYTVQNGDILEKILNVDISLKSDLTKKQKDKIISLIKNTNPSITNWNQLKEKKIIYIEVPFDSVNPNSFLLRKQLNPKNSQDDDDDDDDDNDEVIASPFPKESAVEIITQEKESKFKFRYSLI
ncbi:MAG: hypothetical protein PHY93_15270, partial [Bacteriovorax sp.]|nr:hypothetical protein [Bacteriovorax sp.]